MDIIKQANDSRLQPKPGAKFHFVLYIVIFIVIVALALIAVLIVPLVTRKTNQNTNSATASGIQRLAAHSFGDLSTNVSSSVTRDSSSLTEGVAQPSTSTAIGITTGKISPTPVPGVPVDLGTVYTYVYKGTLPEIPTSSQVYKRVANVASLDASSMLGNFGLGLINLSTFQELGIEQVTLSQKTADGYSVSVNATDGSISITQSATSLFKGAAIRCLGTNCDSGQGQLPAVTVPPDNEIIAIASKFLSDHGIIISKYGTPEVQKNQLFAQPMAISAPQYISDIVSVAYPILVNGKPVYSAYGDSIGMQVSVNIRTKAVSSVYTLTQQQFQTSSYQNETSLTELTKIITRGGLYDGLPDSSIKTTQINLDAPTMAYVQLMKYDATTSDELYVPALVFKISDGQNQSGLWKSRVVVPLVKELLKQNSVSGSGGSGTVIPGSSGGVGIAPESN